MPEYRIRLRRDVADDWVSINPLLKNGEPGYEEDTGRLKIGDGLNRWNTLPYFGGSETPPDLSDLLAHINSLTPHPVYDDGPDLAILYANAKV